MDNVTLCSIALHWDLLGKVYDLDDVVNDPRRLGWPIRRVRLYIVLIAKHCRCKWDPILELFDKLHVARPLLGRVLFTEVARRRNLSAGDGKRLEAYQERFGRDASFLLDLANRHGGHGCVKRCRRARPSIR